MSRVFFCEEIMSLVPRSLPECGAEWTQTDEDPGAPDPPECRGPDPVCGGADQQPESAAAGGCVPEGPPDRQQALDGAEYRHAPQVRDRESLLLIQTSECVNGINSATRL